MKLFKTLKFQITTAFIIQILLLLVMTSITLYELNLRRHDYLILNLSGQLRVISQVMVKQSENYVTQAPRSYDSYERDLGLYHKDLMIQVQSYDKIINAFKDRELSADLSQYTVQPASSTVATVGQVPSLLGESEKIYCKWDKPSRNQLDTTAAVWDDFYKGLKMELGPDPSEPRLEAAARYITLHEDELVQSSSNLAEAFRLMMEDKVMRIRMLMQVSIGLAVIFGVFIMLLLYRKALLPMKHTVIGFDRVARGDLHYQVPVQQENEIGFMAEHFNRLTQRLASLFNVTDKINQATNLDDSLRFVYSEFNALLPINWVGLCLANKELNEIYIERMYSDKRSGLKEHHHYQHDGSLFEYVIEQGKARCIHNLAKRNEFHDDSLLDDFVKEQYLSVIYLPLSINSGNRAVLVFCSERQDAYSDEHMELLQNIAVQISHILDKTLGMESLVVSAVEGLAKLAESRDPETGDHLFRMSMYSAIIAEELRNNETYQEQVTPAYVRDILRFSPMHDIGKVGIDDSILLKPGKLTDEERMVMQQHPVIGAEVLRRCEQQMQEVGHSVFQVGIEIAEGHHEKFDGSGYPLKLSGKAIPLSARIVAVADVFDALTSRRPYKEAWPVDKALAMLDEESGKHFDPDVVRALNKALPRIMEIYEQHKHV